MTNIEINHLQKANIHSSLYLYHFLYGNLICWFIYFFCFSLEKSFNEFNQTFSLNKDLFANTIKIFIFCILIESGRYMSMLIYMHSIDITLIPIITLKLKSNFICFILGFILMRIAMNTNKLTLINTLTCSYLDSSMILLIEFSCFIWLDYFAFGILFHFLHHQYHIKWKICLIFNLIIYHVILNILSFITIAISNSCVATIPLFLVLTLVSLVLLFRVVK